MFSLRLMTHNGSFSRGVNTPNLFDLAHYFFFRTFEFKSIHKFDLDHFRDTIYKINFNGFSVLPRRYLIFSHLNSISHYHCFAIFALNALDKLIDLND